jgi:hypothetical protein
LWTICGHREVFEGLLAPGHGALYPGRVLVGSGCRTGVGGYVAVVVR